MFPFDIKQYVEANPDLVVRRESRQYPGLFVIKYHRRVFYKNLWTPELCELRGLVVDADYNVVARPFTKVFNRGENGTDFDVNQFVTAVTKINGFMAAATTTEQYGLLISTTGSLESDYVGIAAKYLRHTSIENSLLPGFTYLFEICDPSDPHIIDEQSGAYLIGGRELTTGEMLRERELDWVAERLHVLRPRHFTVRFGDLLNAMRTCQHEGYMVYSGKKALKLKSPYYLANKLMARMRDTKLDKWLDSGQIKQIVDEEYYPLVDHINDNREHFMTLDEQARLQYMKDFLHNV